MLFVIALSFFAAINAQEAEEEEDRYGIFDKVKRIISGAADACSNQYISGPFIESVLCGSTIPAEWTSKIGLEFGADTAWCAGLACAYRAMGCHDPTYRIEAQIIAATGQAEDCGSRIGLDEDKCNLLAKFVASPAAAPANKKRATPNAISDMNNEEKEDAKRAALIATKIWAPETEGLDDLFDEMHIEKRGIEDQLQVCSPLIAAGLKLLEGQINLPVNVSEHVGPCGTVCNYAVCGLNILCATNARSILEKVNNDRKFGGCNELTCANFIQAPPSKCQGVTCPFPEGHFQSQGNCQPPKVVHNPTKTSANDCCQRCDSPCDGVRCPAIDCPDPDFPNCINFQVGKYDSFDCCDQCIDPCVTKRAACPPAPTSCPAGQFVGPARPGDCCVSCQPKCVGVSCTGAPNTAADCPAGTVFQDVLDSPIKCSDCCPKCVGGANGSTVKLAGAALAFATAFANIE